MSGAASRRNVIKASAICSLVLGVTAMVHVLRAQSPAPTPVATQLLLDAARRDDAPALAALLAKRADVNGTSEDGTTPLAWAVMRGNVEIARRLLDAGANPNLANAYGVGPLALAISNGSLSLVDLLLQKGADPNLARENGETPLMTASRMGYADVVTLLLQRDANVNARDTKFGQTALMWAAGSPEIVRLLIDHRADLRATTKVWDVKAAIPLPGFRTVGVTGVVWNFDGDYTSKKGGQNAVAFAVQKRDLASVRMLLDAGMDVNAPSVDGTTPLLLSLYKWESAEGRDVVFNADVPMANFLLERGAKMDVADAQGNTPLHGAVLDIVAGGSVRGGRGGGRAFGPGRGRAGGPGGMSQESPSPVASGAMQLVERLLNGGADPNHQTIYPTIGGLGSRMNAPPAGSSPLHIAAPSGNMDLLRGLLGHGANPNLVRRDGLTPFAIAAQGDNVELVKEMVARGADLALRYNPAAAVPDPVEAIALTRQNQSVMHLAAIAGSRRVIEYLFSLGVPLDVKNAQDETPLEMAENQEVFEYVLAYEGTGSVGVWRPRESVTSDTIKKLLAQSRTRSAGNGTLR